MHILDSQTNLSTFQLQVTDIAWDPFFLYHDISYSLNSNKPSVEAVIFVLSHIVFFKGTYQKLERYILNIFFFLRNNSLKSLCSCFYVCAFLLYSLKLNIILSHQYTNESPACSLFLYLLERKQAEDSLLCVCLYRYSVIHKICLFEHLNHRFP